MQWSRTLRQEGMASREWAAVSYFLWWHHHKDQADSQQECPGESSPATPASRQLPYPSPCSWLHWTPYSLHLSLQWFLMVRRWKASNSEEMSRRLSFSCEQLPGFWQNCPSDCIGPSPASIISLWKCPASSGQVQTGRCSSSTHQDAEFSCHLHHLPASFHLTTPCSCSNNRLSDWVLPWL